MNFRLSLNLKITILVIVILNLVLILVGIMISNQIYELQVNQLERTAMDLAQSIVKIPLIANNIGKEGGIRTIQSFIDKITEDTQADFIVVLGMDGIRYSHPVEARLGKHFVGGDEIKVLKEGKSYISEARGTLGLSKRAFAPIYKNEKQVGAVSVGILIEDIKNRINSILHSIYRILFWGDLLGIAGSIFLGNNVKKSIFGLEPIEIATILEEKNAIIDSLKEGIVAIDKNERITLANKEAKKILNWQGDIIGRDIKEVVSNTRLPFLLRSGESEYNKEQIINNTIILTNRIPIKIRDEVVGIVASFSKKNEVQKLAEELTGVKRFAEALRSQNHEFMNKLHTISGLIQLEEYDKAISLISQFSFQKQKLTSFIIKNIKVNEIAGLLLGKFDRANELKIELIIDEKSSLKNDYSKEFKDSLITIIGNLIDNAIESLDSVNKQVKEVYFGVFEEEENLKIIVRDTGVGIPQSLQNRIFERGFSTKDEKFHGVGLDLVRRNIELFSGNLQLNSNVGEGSEFIIRFLFLD